MSRIGKKPVTVPKGVTLELQGNTVAVKGPKGELRRTLHPEMQLALADGQLHRGPAQRGEAAQGAARADPHPGPEHGGRACPRGSARRSRSRASATRPRPSPTAST